MRIGIDSGTTLVKCACLTDDGFLQFPILFNDHDIRVWVDYALQSGATEANIIGIGNRSELKKLKLIRKAGDPIDNELRIQADGTRRILALSETKLEVSEFFLVSIGTGTSYVIVRENDIEKLPFGRALGGGFILGLGRALGLSEKFRKLDELAFGASDRLDNILDIFVKDLIPPEEIDPNDPNLIVANFAKATKYSVHGDLARTIFHCVASNVVQDVAMMSGHLAPPRQVVYIGTPVSDSVVLRFYLKVYSEKFGFKPIFDCNCSHAGALGALHMND